MIQEWDYKVPNLDIIGVMARDDGRPDLRCSCDGCEGILAEAWERMTYGGVEARYGKALSYPLIIVNIAGRVKWIPLAAR